ncbi:MAG: glycosyltransferase family 4 protein [Desulfarculaceae bacterium]|jgi:UDP-glucose:(heptosyl)LPS alpha-1,3-glucosyltransferase
MRIGLIRYKYDQSGGAEQVFGLLARSLAEKGWEVHVITTQWQGQSPEGLEVHLVKIGAKFPKWSRGWRFAQAVRAETARLGLTNWLSLERVPGSPVFRASDGCHAAWLDRRNRFEPFLRRASFRVNPFHRNMLELERRTVNDPGTKRIIAISHMVAEELVRYTGVDPAKIRVVYNGVDEKRLAPARDPGLRRQYRQDMDLPSDRPVFLFLGSGFERKGLKFAIQALAHVDDALLLVAGKGKTGAYERLAQRCGNAQRVRFLGLRSDVAGLLAAADVFILPTIYDPFSMACVEALFAGLPVVTTKAAGAAELIDNGVNGMAVDDPSDSSGLAHACRTALGLGRTLNPQVPSQTEWLEQTMAVITEAAEL